MCSGGTCIQMSSMYGFLLVMVDLKITAFTALEEVLYRHSFRMNATELSPEMLWVWLSVCHTESFSIHMHAQMGTK